MSELTALEQEFFKTGVLPDGLLGESADEPVPISEPAVVTVAPVVTSDPRLDMLQNQLAQEQRARTALEQKLTELATPKTVTQTVTPIDPTVDPLGAMMQTNQQIAEKLSQMEAKLNQTEAQKAQQTQFQTFVSTVQGMRETFAKTTPDYDKAYEFLKSIQTDNLKELGIPQDQIQQILLREEIGFSEAALRTGKNPAEVLYKMANRYGYKTVSSQETPVSQKIETIKKGQEAAKQPARATPDVQITLANLKDAGDDDLTKLVQNDDLWHKVLGGTRKGVI